MCNPPSIANGEMEVPTRINAGYLAKITCHDGFKLNDTSIVSCLSTGDWSIVPACRPLNCGNVTVTEFLIKVEETNLRSCFDCAEGYKMDGENCSICQENEKWTPFPRCIERNCPNISISHGDVERDKYAANITCNVGYLLEGSGTIVCDLTSESWSTFPQCLPIDCGTFSTIDFGSVLYSNGLTTLGSLVSLQCNEGYIPVDQTEAECLSSGV